MFRQILKRNTRKASFVPDASSLPVHVGVIMDGNGRWAKKRGLPRSAGHREGARVFRMIVDHCRDIGIRYLTVYAFSTENWKRPQNEVNAIMDLLREYLRDLVHEQEDSKRVRLHFIGDRSVLASDIVDLILQAEEGTKENTEIMVNIALNYGGRHEITRAVKRIAEKAACGEIMADQIDEAYITDMLDTTGQPDVDLIIRPSGEYRLSNFLIWQSIYAELVFMDILWPDFRPEHFNQALCIYANRTRRFGGV